MANDSLFCGRDDVGAASCHEIGRRPINIVSNRLMLIVALGYGTLN